MAAGLLFPSEMQERLIRLVAGVWCLGTQALIEALIDLLSKPPPDGLGVPYDPKALHGFLLPYKKENNGSTILGTTRLYDRETRLLFPMTGETDIKSLDITLLGTIIFNCTSCQRSSSLNFDVHQLPPTQNLSKGDYVFFMKEMRNKLAHWGLKRIDQQMFDTYWEALEFILKGLEFHVSDEDRDLFRFGPITQEGKFYKGMVLYRLGVMHDSLQDLEERRHASEYKISKIDDNMSELGIKLAKYSLMVAQLNQFSEDSTERLVEEINALDRQLQVVLSIAQEAKLAAERAEAVAEQANATANRAELKADEAISKACAVEMRAHSESVYPQGHLVAEMSWKSLCHLEGKLCNDYQPVARKLGLSRDEISYLDRCNAGGGHPAMNFLTSLEQKCPDVTFADIEKFASSFNRNDIAKLIMESKCRDALLSDSNQVEVKERLAALLSCSKSAVTKDWKDFAIDRFGYDREEVKIIESSIRENCNYRPVKEMFSILKERSPLLTVGELREVFVAVERLDLAYYLDTLYGPA